MDSWAAVLKRIKTGLGLTGRDVREQGERDKLGFPSIPDPFARVAFNMAPALLREHCPAFPGPGRGVGSRGRREATKSAP